MEKASTRQVEVALSVSLVEWFREEFPDADVETTLLTELGEEERGVVLSVDDQEFRVIISDT